MKKIVSIILVLFLLGLTFSVSASDSTPTEEFAVDFKFEVISTDSDKVTVQVSVGDVSGLATPVVLTGSFQYSKDSNISKVTGKGLNNWNVTVEESTNMVLLETNNASSNTPIVELTFEFSDSISSTTGTITFSEINFADGAEGGGYDYTYPNASVNYVVPIPSTPTEDNNDSETPDTPTTPETPDTPTTPETPEEPEQNDNNSNNEDIPEQNIVINTNGDLNYTQSAEEVDTTTGEKEDKGSDDTVSKDKKLPQTGASVAIGVTIVALIILGTVGFVRFKQIQIK